jgi:1-acyl-sn-glycerol-3-phosphate acyltransferase
MGWVYDRFEQINAMPAVRQTVVEKAVGFLKKGEAIYTAPEGDLQDPFHLGRFYPGVGRIYRRSRAPIIPVALLAPRSAMREYPRLAMRVEDRVYRAVFVLRGLYCINIGEPYRPGIREDLDEETDARRIADELRERVQSLVFEVRDRLMPGIDWTTSRASDPRRSGVGVG